MINHDYQLPQKVTCHNCRHSQPVQEGDNVEWYCRRHSQKINYGRQVYGCGVHNWHPGIVPHILVAIHDQADAVEYKTQKGNRFFNGPKKVKHPDVFSSSELGVASRTGFSVLDDDLLKGVRGDFGGRIVEAPEELAG